MLISQYGAPPMLRLKHGSNRGKKPAKYECHMVTHANVLFSFFNKKVLHTNARIKQRVAVIPNCFPKVDLIYNIYVSLHLCVNAMVARPEMSTFCS